LWFDFRWVQANEDAIAEHGMTKVEVEHVVRGGRATRSGDRRIVVGRTRAGRKIKVVYELDDKMTVFVITAYPVE
jgi:uncharacterized DUF497 family protein